jgi:4a-hydroxytetrahydrobiopterin dehydratase
MAIERRALSEDEVAREVAGLSGWALQDGKLHRELRFDDFSAAWGFMSRVALVAEKLDHHPDWSNVWATVVIDLHTHDLGGVSTLDVEFARRVSALAP